LFIERIDSEAGMNQEMDPYYNPNNCIEFQARQTLAVGTVVIAIARMEWSGMPRFRVGSYAILIKEYTPRYATAHVYWGSQVALEKASSPSARALVVVREEDFDQLPEWITQRLDQLANLELGRCTVCGAVWKGTSQFYLEDPGLSQQDHKAPRIGHMSVCCNVQGARATTQCDVVLQRLAHPFKGTAQPIPANIVLGQE
jgi:hypothetical protein